MPKFKIRYLIWMGAIFFLQTLPAHAADETTPGPGNWNKRFRVFGRGLVNIVTLPLEIPRTFVEERKEHPKAWILRFLPKAVGNVVARSISAVHDSVVFPWYASAKDELNPWTASLSLPDYPWQQRGDKPGNSEKDAYSIASGIRG